MSQKGRSGACNVCAAPCSSCMHFDDMEFSGDTCVLDTCSSAMAMPLPTKPEDTEESDIVEHDVKVCDICGDAGREDMLAICSRCTDGAEHTYCMRKMLRKVPGSNWMCEECKFAQQINTQKQGVEAKRLTKSGSSTHFSAKRLAETVDIPPAPKRQALEATTGSPRSSSPVKALSRESSFKNVDKERLKPPQQVITSNRSAGDVQETAHSSLAASRLQNHKGMLVKSKSFNASNSKPKVKLVDEVVPQKHKGVKDHTSVDAKERSRMLQKSMSLKSANLGQTSASDPKVKTFSPRASHTLDSKGPRLLKERHAFDRKNLSKLDRPPNSSASSSTVSTPKADQTPRGESSLLPFSTNSRDFKVQSEGKSTAFKATGTRRPMEIPNTSVGASSATEHKSKDETSYITEKPTNSNTSTDGAIPESLPRSQETFMRSRSTVISSSRSTFCQKCKEIGHSAEFCPSGGLEASCVDASAPTARSSKEEIHGGSKLKEAIHAALLRKPEIQRKKRALDQVDEIPTSTMDLNSETACHDQGMGSNKSKNTHASEGTHEGQQAILRNSPSDSNHSAVNTTTQHIFPTTDAKSSIIKPVLKDLTSHSLAASPQLVKMLAIPEYDYIWRGSFEINRNGSFLELCGGFQAHLSSCVSPRVPEVARKFPQKLSLNEVPRLSAWPTQFCDGGAKEDNIALYFFAKDLESYERNYKILLEGMIKNDLALRGNFEGVELLIYPSNQLPENSQRWNMLFFLWGVFRARRVHNSDSSFNSNIPNERTVSVDRKVANDVMAATENLCSSKLMDAESSDCAKSCPQSGECNGQKIFESTSLGFKASAILQDIRNDLKCSSEANLSHKLMRCSSPSAREKSPPDPGQHEELKPPLMGGGVNSSNIMGKAQLHCDSSVDGEDISSLKEDVGVAETECEKRVLNGRVGVSPPASASYGGASDGIHRDEGDLDLKGSSEYVKVEAFLGRGQSTEGVMCSRIQSTERKRPHIDLSDRAPPEASDETINSSAVDGDNVGKKRKMGQSGLFSRGSYVGVESKPKDLSQCASVEEKTCVEDCEEKVIPEDLGSGATERRFFPVDPRQSGNSSCVGWKSSSGGGREADILELGFPNLELALGAETKPQNKGMLPFLVGLGEKKKEEADDDELASLSLSLSFPMAAERHQAQSQPHPHDKAKAERQRVDTSLLLFGSFPDK